MAHNQGNKIFVVVGRLQVDIPGYRPRHVPQANNELNLLCGSPAGGAPIVGQTLSAKYPPGSRLRVTHVEIRVGRTGHFLGKCQDVHEVCV